MLQPYTTIINFFVATALTVYGIETINKPSFLINDTRLGVATALTVYGIETT